MAVSEETRTQRRRRFVPLAVALLAIVLALGVMLWRAFGVLRVQGVGMAPTLEPGDTLVYRKDVQADDLRAGRLVIYRINPANTWIKRCVLVTARLVATPGDSIAIRAGRYVINGQPTRQAVGSVMHYTRAVAVPDEPGALTVPEACYFVAPDNPRMSFDSQVLSWARREDMVSTDIRQLARNGEVLKKVE
jgi:signal peptidase I